jgi:glycosyltransferase involved in cell wall biosynthesis
VGYDLSIANTAGPAGRRSLVFHTARVAKTLRALRSIAANASSERVCYLAAEGGLGLAYSVMIASWARLLRYRVFIHHHSFSYIIARRRLMGLLLAAAGPQATHICLSDGMARGLASRYRRQVRAAVLSNAAFVDAPAAGVQRESGAGLTIGLLSNLTQDKGLRTFIEILRRAKGQGLTIRGVLAGPIPSDSDHAFLKSLEKELAGRLDYRGPVYGAEKTRFFQDVDVFVFPTTYLNEAQPTVLFEAMAFGLPVISFDRGCIREQVDDAGMVFDQGEDFVERALHELALYSQNPMRLSAHQSAALARYEDERRAGLAATLALFKTPTVDSHSPERQ